MVQRKGLQIVLLPLLLWVGLWLPALGGTDSYKLKTVVIDAGHGGKDPGCLGSHHKEKEVTLAIALKLGKYIEQNHPDVKVVFTRIKDEFVALDERAKIANDHNADLFICIHANAGPKGARGTETFVLGLHKSDDKLAVAQRENAVIKLEKDYLEKYDGFDPNDPASYITFSLFQNVYQEHSLNLAQKIEDQFKNRVKRHSRGVHQAGFLVLYKTLMPAVLIETGFMTYPSEELFLASDEGQTYMASAIYRAFKDYKTELEGVVLSEDKLTPKPAPGSNEPQKPTPSETSAKPGKEELIFRVQVLVSAKALPPKHDVNTKYGPVITEKTSGGQLKYLVGAATTPEQAKTLQDRVRKDGYKDAFVVAFKNGVRIPYAEALKAGKP